MKILLVSASFYPEISPRSFRATELAKEFAREGHHVTVLTHRDDEIHAPFEERHKLKIESLGKVKYRQLPMEHPNRVISLGVRILRRAMLQLLEYPDVQLTSMVAKAVGKKRGFDLLISIAVPYPVHWGVAKALHDKRSVTKKWIADCGDPYMGDKTDSFKKLFYFKYIEKWFCRKADYITVPTPGSVNAYYPEFKNKIRVIPQGFNFNEVPIPAFRGNVLPTFAYAGGFIPGVRDPRQLLEFLCASSKPFQFIIYTNTPDLVLPYVKASKDRVIVKPYIPRDELLRALSQMDFLVNINNGTAVQTPSKLIDYALTTRPVLSINSKEPDLGVIDEFLDGNYTKQLELGEIAQYDIRQVAAKFINLAGLAIHNETESSIH